jgi:phosphonate transport system substrate-binding protein
MITCDTKKTLAALLVLCIFLLGLFASPASGEEGQKESITIGLLPEMNVFKQKKRFAPLADYLSEHLGVTVKMTMLSRYGNIIERIKEDAIDGAFLGSFTGGLAISQLGVVPLARPINMDGTSTYFGHIFVKRGSNIKTVADMKGKSLVLVERATTAGYVFPMAWLKQHGVNDINTYFSEYSFAGSHDGAIDAVLKGKADVGAAKNTIYERMLKADPSLKNKLIILANSPRVPSNALCVDEHIDPQLREKLKNLLLNLHHDAKGIEVLEKLGAKRFVETSSEDYKPVLQLAKDAGIDLENYKYFNP